MKTLTICGSMRYEKEMQEIAFQLESLYGLNILQCTYGNKKLTKEEKYNIVTAHFRKIDLSDGIYVIDIDNSIGESVKYEIEYAQKTGKMILYHSKFADFCKN